MRPDSRRQTNDSDALAPRKCAACRHRSDCSGGCPADNLEATGSIFEPDPATCAFRVAENEVRRRFLELREDVRAAGSP
jgi:sulfatase maturation enzyme AslB (radical SAM superfamily)